MLTSITPVGEVARRQRWSVTAAWFVVGAVAAGAARGGLLGLLGAVTLSGASTPVRLVLLAIAAALGSLLASPRTPGQLPSPHRQVDEQWLGSFRGWVYGVGFGAQLGLGVATYVTTPLVWTLLAAELLTASPLLGAGIGATFGLGRGLQVLLVRGVTTHGELQRVMTRVEAGRGAVQRLAGLANALVVPTALLAALAAG